MKLTESKLRAIIRNEIKALTEDEDALVDTVDFKLDTTNNFEEVIRLLKNKGYVVEHYKDGIIKVHYTTDLERRNIEGIMDRLPISNKKV